MQKKQNEIILSASDINSFINCAHSTERDVGVAEGRWNKPDFKNPHLKVMQQRGFDHENGYIEYLRSKGLSVEAAEPVEGESATEATTRLMKDGVDIITQGSLELGQWQGRSDILRRVEGVRSKFGDYGYVVMDTKLTKETKVASIMQLCLYSEMLEKVQGSQPEHIYVVIPGSENEPFVEEEYRLDDYSAFYRLVRDRLLESLTDTGSYPEPVSHCDVCRWWKECSDRRRNDDHLSLVAGFTKSNRKLVESIGLSTVKKFSEANPEVFKSLPHGTNLRSLELSRKQAEIQVRGRESNENLWEFLPFEDGRGLSRLPEPSSHDLFFDIEGDQFVGKHGLEYLFGLSYLLEGSLTYKGIWADKPHSEKKAFETLMAFFVKHMGEKPDSFIYHYAPYEPSALKRLAQRYSVYERELDHLLRCGKFIDLYGVTKQAIRASVEKYSIKDLEKFYGFTRILALEEASTHKRSLEHCLELGNHLAVTESMKSGVEAYNKDDTDSTYYLREWLEKIREKAVSEGNEILRPEILTGETTETLTDKEERLKSIKEKLTSGIDLESELNAEEQARVLLADLAAFYHRESKANYWEFLRLLEMNEQELVFEKAGISGLSHFSREEPTGRSKAVTDTYVFPPQEVDFRKNYEVYPCGSKDHVGKVESFSASGKMVTIKKKVKENNNHPYAVFGKENVSALPLENALLEICEYYAEHGFTGEKYAAISDILLRNTPHSTVSPKLPGNTSTLDHAYKVVDGLKQSYLPIQGPPGAGKSYTGSHLIEHLLRRGSKIGVCATSHKVISGLLRSTFDLVGEEFRIIHKTGSDTDVPYETNENNAAIEKVVEEEVSCVVGGTSWLFSRAGLEDKLDYLFVDEAGQFSLANMVAVGRSAKNIVLLGDCRQLEQPIKASHPGKAALSALEYIQGEHSTVPEEMGLFLEKTYRLHPDICAFNSELFYENRLKAVEGNESQLIEGPLNLRPLMVHAVSHTGNSSSSEEEVLAVSKMIESLTKSDHEYVLFNSKSNEITKKKITPADIMVVAPYNSQVQRLKEALPEGVEIGTVDKFQGREAPVVIFSVTTSSSDDAPRGLDFLYSGSRLNVAVSRAQCSFIMVANQKIFEPDCSSPAQIKLANAFCRFKEMSSPLIL